MAIKIRAKSKKGGAVQFNAGHGAWASYAVGAVGDLPPAELMHAGAKLADGRSVHFFLNRETGLIVVDVVNKGGRSGREVLRMTA